MPRHPPRDPSRKVNDRPASSPSARESWTMQPQQSPLPLLAELRWLPRLMSPRNPSPSTVSRPPRSPGRTVKRSPGAPGFRWEKRNPPPSSPLPPMFPPHSKSAPIFSMPVPIRNVIPSPTRPRTTLRLPQSENSTFPPAENSTPVDSSFSASSMYAPPPTEHDRIRRAVPFPPNDSVPSTEKSRVNSTRDPRLMSLALPTTQPWQERALKIPFAREVGSHAPQIPQFSQLDLPPHFSPTSESSSHSEMPRPPDAAQLGISSRIPHLWK